MRISCLKCFKYLQSFAAKAFRELTLCLCVLCVYECVLDVLPW